MRPGDLKELAYHFPVRWVAALLPLRVVAALGLLLAELEYLTMRPGSRKHLCDRLARALDLPADSKRARRLSRLVVRHHVWRVLEYGLAPRLKRKMAEDFVELVGFEHAEKGLRAGKGLVLVGGHLATFELHPAVFAWKGYPTGLLEPADTHPDRLSGFVPRLVERYRKSHQRRHLGYETIYTGGALERATGLLARGGVVGIAADFPPSRESQTCRFLGVERPVPSGAARLVLETDAAVVLAQLERVRFGRNRLTFSPVTVTRTGDGRSDVLTLARRLAKGYEEFVHQHPEQWAWLMWRELGE